MYDKLLADCNTCLLQRWPFISLIYRQVLFLERTRPLFNWILRYDNFFLLNCSLSLFECIIQSSCFGFFISWQTWQNGSSFECLNARLLKNWVLNILSYSFLLARISLNYLARLYLYNLNSKTEFLAWLRWASIMIKFIILLLIAIISHW